MKNFIKIGNEETKSIVSNVSWLFSDKILRMGVGLVVGVWIARYLGPENFGKWNYGLALTGVFAAVSTLGLDSLVVKDLVKVGSDEKIILGTSLVMRLVGSVVAVILSYLIVFFTERNDIQMQLIVFVLSLSFIFQSFDVIDLFFQSKVKSKYVVIAKNSVFLICALFRVAGLYFKLSLIYFVAMSTVEIAFGALALLYYYSKKSSYSIFSWKVSKAYGLEKLKECWPIILSGVIIIIYMRIDQIMIKQFLNEKAVGIYSAAVRIVEVWYFVPSTITVSLFPVLIKNKEDNNGYYKTVLKMFRYLFLISFSISVIILFTSEPLITLLFGKAYIAAAFALKISIWTGVFVFWGVGAGNILVLENLNNHNLYKSLSSVFVNVGLNFVLIPKYGINGAAIATLISQAFGSYFYFLIPRATRHIFWLQTKSMFWK
ncbi:flippase [Mucilaginibacter aquaedulcis]|uniref:flippase n=1 Tax=Mucilaginibacter aquaedulcis TaxID=1187081 RepID=UPI0025B5AC65|nr:flippase [Mucilaginibacter aquaedulcis]MDN3547641.1 flippase [Mucilaginibacter aquaedulcis]